MSLAEDLKATITSTPLTEKDWEALAIILAEQGEAAMKQEVLKRLKIKVHITGPKMKDTLA